MDEKKLIDEVMTELYKSLGVPLKTSHKCKEPFSSQFTKQTAELGLCGNAAVLGVLKAEEAKVLEAAFRIVPIEDDCPNADVLILAELPIIWLAQTALGIPQSRESAVILNMLMRGKEVYLVEDGIEYRDYRSTAHKNLYMRYQEYEQRIIKFGVRPITHISDISRERPGKNTHEINESRDASKGIQKIKSKETSMLSLQPGILDLSEIRLLKESQLLKARNQGYCTILLNTNAIITPLAMDYITNHNLTIQRSAKR